MRPLNLSELKQVAGGTNDVITVIGTPLPPYDGPTFTWGGTNWGDWDSGWDSGGGGGDYDSSDDACGDQDGDGETDRLHTQAMQIDTLAMQAVSSMLNVSLNTYPGSFIESLAFIYRDDANRLHVSQPIHSNDTSQVDSEDINALLHHLREGEQAQEIVGWIHTQPESGTLSVGDANVLSLIENNQNTFGLDVDLYSHAYVVTAQGELLRFSEAGQQHAAANPNAEVDGVVVDEPGAGGAC